MAAALSFATPAAAPERCDVNGTSTASGSALSANTLACGTNSLAWFPGDATYGANSMAVASTSVSGGIPTAARVADADGAATAIGTGSFAVGQGASANCNAAVTGNE